VELELLGVLVAVVVLLVFALAINVPYPIALVLGAAAFGFLPGAPDVELPPDLVLLIMLPPLLYSAAFFSSLRDLQANLRVISLLAVGCVLFTMLGVAFIAHHVVGLSTGVAFTLGAIVAPTDAVAATAIASRVGAPRRFVTIIEGESLINDSTALIAYVFAVEAVTTGHFSMTSALGHFVVNAAAGVAIGVSVGYVATQIRKRIEDVQVQSALSLSTPYIAYMPAEAIHVSAVLAVVSCGIYLGWNSPQIITPDARLQLFAIWSLLQFLLNAALFTLVGLQLPQVLDALGGQSPGELAAWAVAITLAVILTRLLWVLVSHWLPKVVRVRLRGGSGFPGLAMTFLVGWAGMRGAVSLAAALALPTDFEDRDLVVFLTYAVIFGTLIVQGLSLPPLIRMFRLDGDETDATKESKARLKAAEAALARIDELVAEDWVREDTADRMRRLYEYRRTRFAARFADDGGAESDGIEARSVDYQRLVREVLEAQRARIVEMRNEGRINDEIMHRIERDLDLEDLRLEV
jgi:Na+/H+ antiporter